MKYIIVYTARRKNARRHVCTLFGRTEYFNSIEEAKQHPMLNNEHYRVEIMTANYKPVEE